MKIEGNRPNHVDSTAQSESIERTQSTRTERERRAQEASGDRVEVSSDARLLQAAAQAAAASPDVRPEAVERGRQKLVSGELGNDLDRLADRLIDSLLKP